MILDTSAVVSLLMKEPGFEKVLEKLLTASSAGIGIPTLTEAAIVLSARMGRDARGLLSRFLVEASIVTIPFGEAHYGSAVEAWLRFGKGRHQAALNFGDCMAYATARMAGQPLLCTGNDFRQTDLELG